VAIVTHLSINSVHSVYTRYSKDTESEKVSISTELLYVKYQEYAYFRARNLQHVYNSIILKGIQRVCLIQNQSHFNEIWRISDSAIVSFWYVHWHTLFFFLVQRKKTKTTWNNIWYKYFIWPRLRSTCKTSTPYTFVVRTLYCACRLTLSSDSRTFASARKRVPGRFTSSVSWLLCYSWSNDAYW
jgi:hypothetical protein